MITSRTSPRLISADVCSPIEASLNVVAICEAMVCELSKMLCGICGRLPMTIVTAIVSPSARPSPRMTAPMIPERAYGRTAFVIISQRVAPSASIASRCESGTAVMTSREIATMVGRIIRVRITPAVNRPTPNGGPAKIGIQPRVSTTHASTVLDRNGPRTNTPHSPNTTDGIAASSSMVNVSGMATRRGASSARKIAVSRPIGVARTIAMKDEAIVPMMNGSAP